MERIVDPFFDRVSTLLRERQAITSWNIAADTVAIAPIIAARIVSESPMQVLLAVRCQVGRTYVRLKRPDCTASHFLRSRAQLAVPADDALCPTRCDSTPQRRCRYTTQLPCSERRVSSCRPATQFADGVSNVGRQPEQSGDPR